MWGGSTLQVVVPTKNEALHLASVIDGMPPEVDRIVVVDDGSTDGSATVARNADDLHRVDVVEARGHGVGAAVATGYAHAVQAMPDNALIAVMDGDGQMDPEDLLPMCDYLLAHDFDVVKGDRRGGRGHRTIMPMRRRLANAGMSFLTGLASGRPVSDAQCGFVVVRASVLRRTADDPVWPGYGYVNHRFIRWSRHGLRVGHHPVSTRYGTEQSGVRPLRFLVSVGRMLVAEHHARAWSTMVNGPYRLTMLAAFLLYLGGWVLGAIGAWHWMPVAWLGAHLLDRTAHRVRRATRSSQAA